MDTLRTGDSQARTLKAVGASLFLCAALLFLPLSPARAADTGPFESAQVACSPDGIIFVDTAATGGDDGSSWGDAFTDLQDGLALARSGDCVGADQVRVAGGTYTPTGGADRNASFALVNGVAVYGGFAGDEDPDFDLDRRDFTTNETTLSGGINSADETDNSYNVVLATTDNDDTAVLDGFTVTEGYAGGTGALQGRGGGVNNAGDPTLSNLVISENKARFVGGGMHNAGGAPTLTDVAFTNNEVFGNNTPTTGDGGGLSNDSGGMPSLADVAFTGNVANSSGGGLYNAPDADADLENATFDGNEASNGSGGGLSSGLRSVVTLADVGFSGNEAASSGGGMHSDRATVAMENGSFEENTALAEGGGAYNTGNSASGGYEFVGVSFEGNLAGDGGGLFSFGNGANATANTTLTEATFTGNEADGAGGGMVNSNSNSALTDVTFSGNTATSGGGMSNVGGAPTVVNVAFLGNVASAGQGGGLENASSEPEISNALFAGNSARDGGAISNVASGPAITNSTFSNNTASNTGGGILNFLQDTEAPGASSPTIQNSILWDNEAGTEGDEVSNRGGTPTVRHSIVRGGLSDGTTDGGNNLDEDPLFADSDSGNYRLQSASRAIDRGDDEVATTTTDLDGNARIVGGTVDLGAYEFQGEPAGAVVSFSPDPLEFDPRRAGTTSDVKTITVTNDGNGPLAVEGVTTTDDRFEVASEDCAAGGPFAPDETCSVSITFAPDSAGDETARLTLTTNASGSPQTARLSGTGTAPAASLDPASVDFKGRRADTTSDAETVTLTNTGTASLTVNEVGLSDGGAGFAASDDGCEDAELRPEESCEVEVTFTPDSAGEKGADLLFDTDASDEPGAVALSGEGLEPVASLSPETLDFQNQRVGTTSNPQTVSISNTGDAPLAISSVRVSGDDADLFSKTEDCSGESVAPGESCETPVTFSPNSVGGKSASLVITDDASGSPREVSLSGVGVSPEASLRPESLAFGGRRVETRSAPRTATLTNTGDATLAVGSVGIAGPNPAQFGVSSDGCSGAALEPRESCEVGVRFSPTAAGAKNASLKIPTDASEDPATVALSGVGKPAPRANPNRCTIVGTPGNDVLRGTPGRDVICGLGGNDRIYGLGGNDILRGGPSNDLIHGGPGNDRLFGQGGNDRLTGGPGKDRLDGGGGRNQLRQ